MSRLSTFQLGFHQSQGLPSWKDSFSILKEGEQQLNKVAWALPRLQTCWLEENVQIEESVEEMLFSSL